ncbi:VOC family protein [Companilactobacillus jidongensis]|uniref:VOC family protein n=1 Tax=Companilactobacillus jidongensis TaxID=2486006 RepID=UPI000F7A0CFB|nr:VOC family protein [Companilactobacillus jidongensis]
MKSITPFITLNGNSEVAMRYYAEIIPNAEITQMDKFDDDPQGKNDKVFQGVLNIDGMDVNFLDMKHDKKAPDLNWSFSLMVECSSENEFDELFDALSNEGTIVMGPEPICEYEKATWVTDKFGVTWQLVL